MKKIIDLDKKMLTITVDEDDSKMLTRRGVLQLLGNAKVETADDSRRARRILMKLRDKGAFDLVLENDDMAFLEKFFEKNAVGLPAWMHGQVMDLFDSAEKVDPPAKA
jgi:cyanophycinase-like exopeptidase